MMTRKFRCRIGLVALALLVLGGALPALAEEAAAPATLESMMGAFSDVRMGLDTVWVLVAGDAGVLDERRLRAGRERSLPGEEHDQHPGEELHRLRRLDHLLLGPRLGPDVRRRQLLRRPARLVLRLGRRQLAGPGLGLRGDEPVLDRRRTRASTARSTGRRFRCGRSSSSSSCSPERPRRSSRARWPSASSSSSFLVFSFLLVAFVYPITGHWIWGGGWPRASTQLP